MEKKISFNIPSKNNNNFYKIKIKYFGGDNINFLATNEKTLEKYKFDINFEMLKKKKI